MDKINLAYNTGLYGSLVVYLLGLINTSLELQATGALFFSIVVFVIVRQKVVKVKFEA